MINSDSLAADSLRDGGRFADGNAAPSAQPARSTTTNTTDTSGATTLEPARDRQERLTSADTEGKDYRAPVEGLSSIGSTGSASSTAGLDSSNKGESDSYGQSGAGGSSAGLETSKESNTMESGTNFNGAPNASFTTNIGGKDDPGRESLNYLASKNAKAADDAGHPAAAQQVNCT